MSQVIVTNDNFSDKRAHSREQEHKIDRESFPRRWKKATDATKPSLAAAAIGILALPIVGFWAFILFLMSVCLTIFVGIMRGLGLVLSVFRK